MENGKIKAAGLHALTALSKSPNSNDTSIAKENATAESCDRYQTCSANICPCDDEWQKRVHHKGERVCFYLIEASKTRAKAIFRDSGREYLYELMQEAIPLITGRHYPIKYALEQAKKTGSRMTRKFGGGHE